MAKRGNTSPGIASDRKWEVRSGLETLARAEEIKSDKALMRDIKKLADQTAKAVNSAAPKKGKR